ncbi:PIN domain-containing protein [Tenggerimyces flavus]|uniref:PIN domain-containing protein n=1 Tax=Tenggerimyces flavus TaxID=1708749 RepID=A0ABV7Y852_9ACTN|nr:PIN domain-containing protein [Tenggerimyces flavus]MBM7784978.1 putative nucleic acid-binding protein [Tenggerimyces flavus]
MAFVVVYDADVLYRSTVRDLLIRIGQSGLVQAKWTDDILDEAFDNIRKNRPDLNPTLLERTRSLMMRSIRDCMVMGYEPRIDAVKLPDPGDRHVLAAAIKARAQLIVTYNLRDFPKAALDPWNVEAKHPDDFVLDQIGLDKGVVHSAVQQMADAWSDGTTTDDVLHSLERDELVGTVAALRS